MNKIQQPKGNLGTFGGVFTPSILTILGLILFLRLGYVVGSGGIYQTLLILVLANTISVLTTFSLSAISTNLNIKRGGDYYLISRTLGVEYGGAIGIVLFLAQSVSIGFYCIGFGEALSGVLPVTSKLLPQAIAAIAIAFLFVFAWLGSDWATKLQYVIMVILALALVSFFVGAFGQWQSDLLIENRYPVRNGPKFWVLFAIFFPAVTGFTQGVSMSGELKDPGKSLPLGTFIAVGFSILVYFTVTLLFSATMPADVLTVDYLAMKRVAAFGPLIDAGVIAATLSSAMASFLGAPRILQSMAADKIMPILEPFAKGAGEGDNPRRGVLLAGIIAMATVGLGNLNVIAPVVSMFFLVSYGLLNYATYFEARSASPSFRPRFKFYDIRISLAGFVACLACILAINPVAGIVSISLLFGIYQYLKRTAGPSRWADSRRSYHLQKLREYLLLAHREPEHPRDWRPQLLVFSNSSERREKLLRFASWMEGGSGTTSVVKIIEGDGIKMVKRKVEAEEELNRDIKKMGIDTFPLVIAAPDIKTGLQILVQSYGVGPIHVNTILLNWMAETTEGLPGLHELIYSQSLRTAFRFGCNIVVLEAKDGKLDDMPAVPETRPRIDIWWFNNRSSRLSLIYAYLLTRNDHFANAKIRVLAFGSQEERYEQAEKLKTFLDDARISGRPEIIDGKDVESIVRQSSDATVVFVPFHMRKNQLVDPLGNSVEYLVKELPVVAFIMAAEDVELDAEPEEGEAAETAAALDAVSDAQKNARDARKNADQAVKDAGEKIQELKKAALSKADGDDLRRMVSDVKDAKKTAEKSTRKSVKALAKMDTAVEEAAARGIDVPDGEEKQQ
jgi:amino acid transporter